jgi:hypothetical protein
MKIHAFYLIILAATGLFFYQKQAKKEAEIQFLEAEFPQALTDFEHENGRVLAQIIKQCEAYESPANLKEERQKTVLSR